MLVWSTWHNVGCRHDLRRFLPVFVGLCVAALSVWRLIPLVCVHGRFAVLFCTCPEHNASQTRAVFLLLLIAEEIKLWWVYIHSMGNGWWDKAGSYAVLHWACFWQPSSSPKAHVLFLALYSESSDDISICVCLSSFTTVSLAYLCFCLLDSPLFQCTITSYHQLSLIFSVSTAWTDLPTPLFWTGMCAHGYPLPAFHPSLVF